MPDPIFALFGKRIAKRLAANYYRPLTFKDMTFAFTDTEGHSYYAWQNFGEMPPARVKNIEAIMLMIDLRMSDKDLATISDDQQKLINESINAKDPRVRSDLMAKLTILAQELKYRAKDLIPEDLYYDLAAHCVVRDDETPGAMDRTIHVQKFNMLRDAGLKGASFFLHMPTFGDLLGALLTTEAGLVRLLPKWRRQKERRAMMMGVLASKAASVSTTENLKGSPFASRAARSKAMKG